MVTNTPRIHPRDRMFVPVKDITVIHEILKGKRNIRIRSDDVHVCNENWRDEL